MAQGKPRQQATVRLIDVPKKPRSFGKQGGGTTWVAEVVAKKEGESVVLSAYLDTEDQAQAALEALRPKEGDEVSVTIAGPSGEYEGREKWTLYEVAGLWERPKGAGGGGGRGGWTQKSPEEEWRERTSIETQKAIGCLTSLVGTYAMLPDNPLRDPAKGLEWMLANLEATARRIRSVGDALAREGLASTQPRPQVQGSAQSSTQAGGPGTTDLEQLRARALALCGDNKARVVMQAHEAGISGKAYNDLTEEDLRGIVERLSGQPVGA
jgi:hypothetical protein